MKIKIRGLVTAAVLSLTLCACGSDDADDNDDNIKIKISENEDKNLSGNKDNMSEEEKNSVSSYSGNEKYYGYSTDGNDLESALEENDNGFYRAEKSFFLNIDGIKDFGLNGINYTFPRRNTGIDRCIEALGYARASENEQNYSIHKGGTVLSDSLLGIKYVMDSNDRENIGTGSYMRFADPSYSNAFRYDYIIKTPDTDTEAVIDVYENPDALSVGYMADESIMDVAALGNDNTFNSQNIFMSTLCGNTSIDYTSGMFESFTEYFRQIPVDPDSFQLVNVTASPYADETLYTADTAADDYVVNMRFVPQSNDPVYIYLKTDYQLGKVNLWLSAEKDETGEYINHRFVSTYFTDFNYHAVCLGNFEAGQEVELRMTVLDKAIVSKFWFYQFDYNTFKSDLNKLKQQQWEITAVKPNQLEGAIEAKKGQVMFTSVPYDENWSVEVDGEELDFYDNESDEFKNAEQCFSCAISTFIAVKLSPGIHTVKMTYQGSEAAPLRLFSLDGLSMNY